MDIKRGLFGATKEEKEAYIFTLENSKGMKAQVTNYGAILVSLFRVVYKKNEEVSVWNHSFTTIVLI
ncbi:hypothetical protein LL033_17960 [Clostridium estertheticum]|uniref:hypothetical protein n=1 Tax=Clostridium estertheticum TaxID=238834 RepID=UPI001C0C973B|nr:hypothetical protein [Clostridium estertheticum]MBU3216554.1 hypothetical protein [Clostridium estertheticum]WAG54494.1 hypothetical protein LL033_17960 [Clostridium estertheticum]